MASIGFQKVYRSIQNHWLWEDKPFSRGQAFIDLILLVNHADNKALIDGELIEVKRGSRITSLRKLSDQWGWSTTKVKRFLEQLEKDKMITYKSNNKKTLVTIENYDDYQGSEIEKVTEKKQSDNTEVTQKKTKKISEKNQKKTNKNDKEYINNDKEWEEGEEKIPTLPPLSIPSNIHKDIYEYLGEVGYRMWFMDTGIEERDGVIEIYTEDAMKQGVIKNSYINRLETLLNKKVQVIS